MQTQTISANGKQTELTPNCNATLLNPEGKGSVEYARARSAINEDFKLNFPRNEALAKRIRKESKRTVVSFLKGEVTRNTENKLIVTFPDKSIARL